MKQQHDHEQQHDHHAGAEQRRHEHSGWRQTALAAWLKRRFLLLLAGLYLLSGLYFVAPEQQAVVSRFGRVVAKGVPPGVHYHLPWPIESIVKLKVLESKRLTIGVELPDRALGRTAAADPPLFLTGDQNLITVQATVQYAINDPAAWLYRAEAAPQFIARAVEAALAQAIAAEPVDNVLTTGRLAVQNATLANARARLAAYALGVHLGSINIETVTPPAEVSDAFREVASARADRDRIINEARGDASDASARAAGEAEKLKSEAAGWRQQRINEAQGDAARFTQLYAESRRAKAVTEQRLYLETMEEILPRVRKVVIDSAGAKSLLDLGIIKAVPEREKQ